MALRSLTDMLPRSAREAIHAFVDEGPTNDVILRSCVALIWQQQARVLSAYDSDCKVYESNLRKAKTLRRRAAQLKDKNEARALQAQAIALENARPNHEAVTSMLSTTSERIRRLTDSLTIQNPAHFTRVEVGMSFDGDGPWSASPEDNVHMERTELDEEYLRKVKPTLLEVDDEHR